MKQQKTILFAFSLFVMAFAFAFSAHAAVTGCINNYQYNNTGNVTNVTTGNVCVNSTSFNVAPNAIVNCQTIYDCVADAQSATQYYNGYTGAGACTATGQVATGTVLTLTGNRKIRSTQVAQECDAYGYGQTYEQTDLKNIVVDGLGVVGASIVEWLDLIVLLIVLGFIIGIFVKLGGLFK